MPKFTITHPMMVEVRNSDGGYVADVFDLAWGKVYTTRRVSTKIVAESLARDACRKISGDVPVNVFDHTTK